MGVLNEVSALGRQGMLAENLLEMNANKTKTSSADYE